MTESEEVLALVIQASKNLGNDYELPADDSFCDDEIEALAEVIRLAKDDQKQSMLASGWRQCAQGQGASQFCEQAEASRQEIERLTWTLEAAQAIWNKIEKGLREEIKTHEAWLGQAHALCGDLGIPPGHIEDRLFAAIGRAGQLVGHAEAQRFVRLHETNDGVWAHFRVGNGYAYSVNLSADPMSRKFAIEYHNMAAGVEALLKGEPE